MLYKPFRHNFVWAEVVVRRDSGSQDAGQAAFGTFFQIWQIASKDLNHFVSMAR